MRDDDWEQEESDRSRRASLGSIYARLNLSGFTEPSAKRTFVSALSWPSFVASSGQALHRRPHQVVLSQFRAILRITPHKRRCSREGFSVHALVANNQNEARSGLCAMRPWQELALDPGPRALGSEEPIERSVLIRIIRTAAWPRTKPSCSSHNKRPSPKESTQDRAPFESSVHCT